ncbi:GntR family transcriptional regulator [Photobacterium sanctipauli]|uniref:GntR family transcriptional regulator n=3 Tax=Photobacterium sanctipauli TaxID=1342794 RepID=A0A2T3NXF8_9GAMM|nr:GntR family transcriptional regulator [Photobacterium sanctipauli]
MPPYCSAADPNIAPASFVLPDNACDCHLHVFGPENKYPYTENRTYTPPDASLGQYKELQSILGLKRAVIVQPSVYGVDNRATLEAVKQGGENFKAVVVVNDDIATSQLESMAEMGAKGARLNLLFQSNVNIKSLESLAHKLAETDMHLQLLIDVSKSADLMTQLGKLPVQLVFDHMGHMPTTVPQNNVGFQAMLKLMDKGKAWAKLSGSYRFTSEKTTPYHDVTKVAQQLISTNSERVVWGSDWPHPHIPVDMPRDGDLLEMLKRWAPDENTRNNILVNNPAHLYGFKR